MSEIRQETQTFRRVNYTSPPETVRATQQQLFTSYTNEPNILRDDYAHRKVDRPEAYQFWHKKEKYGSYASRVLHTNYRASTTGQTLQINNSSIPLPTSNGMNCCSGQEMVVTVVVVSRDEIEAPWREECLYLQSVIEQLEKKKDVQIVKEVDNTKVNQLEEQIRNLNGQLRQAKMDLQSMTDNYSLESSKNQELLNELAQCRLRITELEESTVVTENITYLNNEVEVWKKKFVQINHEYNDCQEKLMMAEAELEALKKEKTAQRSVVTTSVVRSSTRQQTGAKSSGFQSSSIQKQP